MSNKQSTLVFDKFSDGEALTYPWAGNKFSYSMFSASLVDSSSEAYVCESSPSGVCETDSVIGLEIFIQLFVFSKITIGSYRIIFVSFLCTVTIIDWGHSAVYTHSRRTDGLLWSLSFLVSYPAENLGWAQSFKVVNGKPSWKSRWFLWREKLQKNIQKENKKQSKLAINGIWQWKYTDC